MLSASGERFTQAKAIELSRYQNIILLCGHYEGFDHRITEHLIDEEISIGDYVLTGGEIPAMVIIDATTRMIPGVIKEESIISESFMPSPVCHSGLDPESPKNNIDRNNKFLEQARDNKSNSYDYPVYTRPVEYRGWRVPEVLLSGDHKQIEQWRDEKSKRD